MGTCHFWLHIGLQGWVVFWRLTQSRGRRIYNRFDCIFDGLGPKFLRFLDISLLLTFLFRGFGFSTNNSISPEQYFSRKGEKLHQSPSEEGGGYNPYYLVYLPISLNAGKFHKNFKISQE